ncbi:hypothetical protein [Asticcacaulis sp. W401b]|uniref:hypothetical protein n=1 Tax=Asticcacaulis sp. W401b TaxID=3388666 RepID=UPI003970DAED
MANPLRFRLAWPLNGAASLALRSYPITPPGGTRPLYAYTGGDPINNTDPTGTCSLLWEGGEGCIGKAVQYVKDLFDRTPTGRTVPLMVGGSDSLGGSGEVIWVPESVGLRTQTDTLNAMGGALLLGALAKDAPNIKSKGISAPDYSSIPNPAKVTVGGDFTLAQRKAALELNMKANGGVVKSDYSGKVLTKPKKSQRGVTPDPNEWQFDHKIAKAKGGTNESSNIAICSRAENRAKSCS